MCIHKYSSILDKIIVFNEVAIEMLSAAFFFLGGFPLIEFYRDQLS